MLLAHIRRDKDLFLPKAIFQVIEDNVKEKKWKNGRIRRWAYEVGFRRFAEIPEFAAIFNYFKTNIADVLASKGGLFFNVYYSFNYLMF